MKNSDKIENQYSVNFFDIYRDTSPATSRLTEKSLIFLIDIDSNLRPLISEFSENRQDSYFERFLKEREILSSEESIGYARERKIIADRPIFDVTICLSTELKGSFSEKNFSFYPPLYGSFFADMGRARELSFKLKIFPSNLN